MHPTPPTEPVEGAAPDPHDPLAPRPDDPRIGRWWWNRRLYSRHWGRRPRLGRSAIIVLMMLLLGVVALAVVLLVPSR